jgi:nucleoside-diphosphate-sugar epimerase
MILEVAKGMGVRRFVFASSCSVYGATEKLVDEQSETAPVSLYAQTKLDCEQMLLDASCADFHPGILRLATVFGDSYRPRFDLAVNLLTAKAHVSGLITIFNGDSWRPFVHVQDVAQGMIAMLRAPEHAMSGQIFNLGDSRLNYTLNEIAEEIRRVVPGARVSHTATSDRRNYRVSFDKIRDQIGFVSSVGIKEGIVEVKRALEGGSVRDYEEIRYNNFAFVRRMGAPANKSTLDARVMASFLQAQPHGSI